MTEAAGATDLSIATFEVHLTSPGLAKGAVAYTLRERECRIELAARPSLFGFASMICELSPGCQAFTGLSSALDSRDRVCGAGQRAHIPSKPSLAPASTQGCPISIIAERFPVQQTGFQNAQIKKGDSRAFIERNRGCRAGEEANRYVNPKQNV